MHLFSFDLELFTLFVCFPGNVKNGKKVQNKKNSLFFLAEIRKEVIKKKCVGTAGNGFPPLCRETKSS